MIMTSKKDIKNSIENGCKLLYLNDNINEIHLIKKKQFDIGWFCAS